jgi:hypothetical protein
LASKAASGPEAQRRGRGRRQRGADEEGDVVAAGQRRQRIVSGGQQRLAPRGGEAGEERQPERVAEHEPAVHDARGEAGLARLDVAHRREQHGLSAIPA